MRTGYADLPLHRGHAPRWLFERTVLLAREMALAVLASEGPAGVLRRLADPVWFQAFGCVLGFDWHSSGVTTTASGALKEGLRTVPGAGLVVAGGKGRTSRRTPQEIEAACWGSGQDAVSLVRASRLAARVVELPQVALSFAIAGIENDQLLPDVHTEAVEVGGESVGLRVPTVQASPGGDRLLHDL